MNNELNVSFGETAVRSVSPEVARKGNVKLPATALPEILFITSYPPRECGIATYSQDLVKSLNDKFTNSFSLKICALEAGKMQYQYPEEVKFTLDTNEPAEYKNLANAINSDPKIQSVVIQHEFGFFHQAGEEVFLQFLYGLSKPVVVVFHTVLPNPNDGLRSNARRIAGACDAVIVMTDNASQILQKEYGVAKEKIEVIPHGTHLVPHLDKNMLKEKYGIAGRKVLSTFGLLSSGKSIETTLDALPSIVEQNPDVMFLVIGKTHPGVVKSEGERYREMLQAKVKELKLTGHVQFINRYLSLEDLLEYLQLTDIYLFTSKDPHQAVSGTFSYAMSCGCPIISTPIPHAKEVLSGNNSMIVDFQNPVQLSEAVNRLMSDDELRLAFSAGILQRIVPTAWENSAIAHALLIQRVSEQNTTPENNHMSTSENKITLEYRVPEFNLAHIKKMTTEFGMIQFSKINQPDLGSGYTLDDNARAMIAVCMHYELTRKEEDLDYIRTYLDFIKFCQQPKGNFLNYVDEDKAFTPQNEETNLEDSNGRAIWALGYVISKGFLLPRHLTATAEEIVQRALPYLEQVHSTRAMAFIIKGLYYSSVGKESQRHTKLVKTLADRMVGMYKSESEEGWQWYESYLTYANSILPEAMLCAWVVTGNPAYRQVARTTFDFLLSKTFNEEGIKVISNRSWMQKGEESEVYGEQPIDIAYSVLALFTFFQVFRTPDYSEKMKTAFNWFLGQNHLHHIVYNPRTGGCYDGLEETHVNLNQGAESTVSYMMARCIVEKYQRLYGK
jgi:glycosyltransferase involved in cell wall biosynthesis